MELAKMKLELDKLSTNYDEYKRGYDELKADYNGLSTRQNKLEIDYDKIKADYNELSTQQNELETDYEELKANYDELLLSYNKLSGDAEIVSVGLDEIKETPQSNELIERHFTWEYSGEWNWGLQISEALYNYYHELPRPPTRNYSVYVTHPLDDIYIERLVETIKESAAQQGFDEYQTVEFTIAFVQSLPYTVDSVTSPFDEYPRYPVETLVDGGGDCEDTSILLASLLSEMGYGVVLISPPNHMAVGVKGGDNIYGTSWTYEGDKYYYIETTGIGRRIGELPEEYEGASAHLYPLIPTPIITHEWSIESKEYYYDLQVTVTNLGSATANNVSVFAGFDAGEDSSWSGKYSETFQLEVGAEVIVTMSILPPPSNVRTRLKVYILMGDYYISKSYSDWYDT
ncbi:hypothetical protein ACFLWI_01955 [Chloroflexota bacterium]